MIYQHLFTPGIIGGRWIKNRIVMAPMATGLGTNSGEVTDNLVEYYAERARGGVGTVIVEAASVDGTRAREGMQQIRIDSPVYIAGLSRIEMCIRDSSRLNAIEPNQGRIGENLFVIVTFLEKR